MKLFQVFYSMRVVNGPRYSVTAVIAAENVEDVKAHVSYLIGAETLPNLEQYGTISTINIGVMTAASSAGTLNETEAAMREHGLKGFCFCMNSEIYFEDAQA